MHNAHNTPECRNDKKDGTPRKGTFGQSGRKSGKHRNLKKSYTQVLARMKKLEKSLKKTSKRGKNLVIIRKVTETQTPL